MRLGRLSFNNNSIFGNRVAALLRARSLSVVASPSAPPHVALEEIYISGFSKSYNELKEAPPVGGMP